MSRTIRLTSQGVCDVLKIERHTLRRWLEGLPLFSEQPTRARSARRFDMADVVFLAAIQELQTRYGLALASLARFDASLHETLRDQGMGLEFLFMDIGVGRCSAMLDGLPARPGIVLDLGPVYRRVGAAFSIPTLFPELPFTSSAPSAASP